MKLAFFDDFKLGVIKGDSIVNVEAALGDMKQATPQQLMEHVIEDFQRLRPKLEEAAAKGKAVSLSRVRLRPPLPKQAKMVCAPVNYLEFGTRQPAPLPGFTHLLLPPARAQGNRLLP